MKSLIKTTVALSLLATLGAYASERIKLPTVRTTAQAPEQRDLENQDAHIRTLIRQAREEVAFDKDCFACVKLAKNQLLEKSPGLQITLPLLEFMINIPTKNFEKAVSRFQKMSGKLCVSKAEIRKACTLWSRKTKPVYWCQKHNEQVKEKIETKRG